MTSTNSRFSGPITVGVWLVSLAAAWAVLAGIVYVFALIGEPTSVWLVRDIIGIAV